MSSDRRAEPLGFELGVDGETLACLEFAGHDDRPAALILHGAGESRKERFLPLMALLGEHGIGSVAFDFSGHGESTGMLAESSLERRRRQAGGVLADLVERRRSPVILIGFSMSGQTVCDLLAAGGTGVSAAVLCCPAVYAPEADGIPFGDPAFTRVLRSGGSWRGSSAFEALRGFRGPVLIVRPGKDEVIPAEISDRIVGARSRARSWTCEHVIADAPHQLTRWFADRPADLRQVVGLVAALAGPRASAASGGPA